MGIPLPVPSTGMWAYKIPFTQRQCSSTRQYQGAIRRYLRHIRACSRKKGQQYHHIFSSKTGYPIVSNVASLTIIADKSLDCDIYTTELFGLDAASIIHKVNRMEHIEAAVITTDGEMAYTERLQGKIQPISS